MLADTFLSVYNLSQLFLKLFRWAPTWAKKLYNYIQKTPKQEYPALSDLILPPSKVDK